MSIDVLQRTIEHPLCTSDGSWSQYAPQWAHRTNGISIPLSSSLSSWSLDIEVWTMLVTCRSAANEAMGGTPRYGRSWHVRQGVASWSRQSPIQDDHAVRSRTSGVGPSRAMTKGYFGRFRAEVAGAESAGGGLG